MARKPIGKIILMIVLGAMIGSLVGLLIGLVIPAGVVKDFFLKSANLELGPSTLNLGFFAITFGFKIILNIAGLIGIAIAVYILRWY